MTIIICSRKLVFGRVVSTLNLGGLFAKPPLTGVWCSKYKDHQAHNLRRTLWTSISIKVEIALIHRFVKVWLCHNLLRILYIIVKHGLHVWSGDWRHDEAGRSSVERITQIGDTILPVTSIDPVSVSGQLAW